MIKIKSPDDRRIIRFCVISVEHEHNHEFVRRIDASIIESDRLKI